MIGLRFKKETSYCLIDIDRGSVYHPSNSYSGYKNVLAALEKIGLCRPEVVRSSDSDGIHVYYFLPELLPTFNLAKVLKFALGDAGLQLRSGQLEIFPNTKAYAEPDDDWSLYNGHRLPLQKDSYLLDDDLNFLTNDVAQFLDATDVAAAHQDLTALKKAIAAAKKRPLFNASSRPSVDVQRVKREIENEIAEGWTGFHQTNNLLIRMANNARVWLGLSGKALVDYIEATAIAAPGYKEYCRHQHEIRRRAAEVAKMAEGYWTPYRSYPARCGKSYQATFLPQGQQNNIVEFSQPNQANIQRSQQTAERIRQAVDHLIAKDELPSNVSSRAAAIIATLIESTGSGMSVQTLYKPCHKSLWHPAHQESPEPAQGEALHPVLEVDHIQESPEPAQGEALHPISPYEVFMGRSNASKTSFSSLSSLLPSFQVEAEGEREGEISPTAPTEAPQPAAQPAESSVTADESAAERIRCKLRLIAINHGKKTVQQLPSSEKVKLTYKERLQLEEIYRYRFLWQSSEPELMAKARDWAIKNPGLLPEAEVFDCPSAELPSTGAISPSVPQNH